jgi:hypothetical protein
VPGHIDIRCVRTTCSRLVSVNPCYYDSS